MDTQHNSGIEANGNQSQKEKEKSFFGRIWSGIKEGTKILNKVVNG